MDEGFQVEMAANTETSLSDELSQVYAIEWDSLRSSHHNVLLEGSRTATDAALLFLKPYLRNPLVWMQPGMPLSLQQGRDCTLVLRDVAALTLEEQEHIVRWLNDPRQRLQAVATSTTPLYARVTRGLFDETLFYRLNVLLLRVDSHF